MSREYQEMEANGASVEELEKFGAGRLRMAAKDGDTDYGSVMIGQIAGMMKEIQTVEEIVQELVNGLPAVVENIKNTVEAE